jgi:3-phosphoshikimate 1-carboxyvinyltransferase
MRDTIEITPKGALEAEVVLPGSKSITHRALFCAALAEGISTIHGALLCTDTEVSAACLRVLGAEIEADERSSSFRVTGFPGVPRFGGARLNAGDCGTALRFLTALVTLGGGEYTIEGGRVERPIGELVDALRSAGCKISYGKREGYPPVTVSAAGFPGGRIRVGAEVSSQYVSALLLAAPYAQQDVEIEIAGRVASAPYIDVTIDVMRAFGIDVAVTENVHYVPAGFGYEGTDFHVEGDASAATYFLAAAGICGGRVRVKGVGVHSRQADMRFTSLLEEMGCRVTAGKDFVEAEGLLTKGVHADMRDMPDAVPTLAAAACFAETKTLITGIKNLRVKESDRIAAIGEMLTALGARVEASPDSLEIYPSRPHGGKVDPHGDHRIAMSAALIGLKAPGVVIKNPGCVSKSFPRFFAEIENLSERSKS